jgi:magnesium chelatase family protein
MDAPTTRRVVPVAAPLARRLLAVPDPGLLSGRGHDRVLRVARTIADLDGRDELATADVDEALAYRLSGFTGAAA